MQASEVIDRAQIILNDTSAVRWLAADLLEWLNDGVRAICHFVPEASVTTEFVQLAQGTKQSLTTLSTGNALRLIDVTRNVTDGTGFPALRAVRSVDRRELDMAHPTWHADATGTTVTQFMYDPRNPLEFFVYPPQPASGQAFVELVYSSYPADLTADTQTVGIDDTYVTALVDYIVYRALSIDAEYGANPQRVAAHWQAFVQAAQGKAGGDPLVEPTPGTKATEVAGNRNG
jgi:hypothetical protein